MFHVSQLKKAVGTGHQVTPVLPTDFAIKLAPEQVLDTRVVSRGANQVQQVFIKWNNLPSTLASWKDYDALRQEFPRATAWGQAVFQEGKGVSTVAGLAKEGGGATPQAPRRSNRPRKPNNRYRGFFF